MVSDVLFEALCAIDEYLTSGVVATECDHELQFTRAVMINEMKRRDLATVDNGTVCLTLRQVDTDMADRLSRSLAEWRKDHPLVTDEAA